MPPVKKKLLLVKRKPLLVKKKSILVKRKPILVKKRPRGLPQSGAEKKFSYDPWGTSGKTHDNCYDYAFDSFSKNRTTKSVPGDRSGMGANGLTFTTCKGIAERVLSDNPGNVYKMKGVTEQCKPGFYKVMCLVAPSNDFGNSTGDFHWIKHIGSVRYKIRAGDTIHGLAKFFHVKKDVIQAAFMKKSNPNSPTNGRIANSNLNVLNKNNERVAIGKRLTAGGIIDFPANLWAHKQGWAGGPLLVDASGKTIPDPRKANFNYKPGFHYTKICSVWGVRAGVANTGSNSNR